MLILMPGPSRGGRKGGGGASQHAEAKQHGLVLLVLWTQEAGDLRLRSMDHRGEGGAKKKTGPPTRGKEAAQVERLKIKSEEVQHFETLMTLVSHHRAAQKHRSNSNSKFFFFQNGSAVRKWSRGTKEKSTASCMRCVSRRTQPSSPPMPPLPPGKPPPPTHHHHHRGHSDHRLLCSQEFTAPLRQLPLL